MVEAMISSSADRRSPPALQEDSAIVWSPEEFTPRSDGTVRVPDASEQDALIEAMTEANAAREREFAAELEQCATEAYASGYEKGRREGEVAEGARLRAAVQAAELALDEIRAGESRWQGGIEENICALAVAVARQVLEREIRSSPQVVLDLVRRAVAEFPVDRPIRIRVSPSDLTLINGAGNEEVRKTILDGREARWIADPMITPGGCVVEGRERIIDGRIDSALERLYRRLTYTSA